MNLQIIGFQRRGATKVNSARSCSGRLLRRAPFVIFNWLSITLVVGAFLRTSVASAQIPDWCKQLPHPEYKSLERVTTPDPWFKVYEVAPDTFAIYEPHQAEEVISYLILGKEKALLFDTGMGISDIRKLVAGLTALPVIVLNSHTHDDHVGGNWQFDTIYSMDTDFSRQNAKGSMADAQDELAPGQICGELPKGFDAKTYRTKPWKISKFVHNNDEINLGGRILEIIFTPGHTPDSICLRDRSNGLLFTGDTYYPAAIWLYRPETNLDAYSVSIEHIALISLLDPPLKLVLGAHNVPVAPPSVLTNLPAAFADLRCGKANCKPDSPGKKRCTIREYTFLLAAAA